MTSPDTQTTIEGTCAAEALIAFVRLLARQAVAELAARSADPEPRSAQPSSELRE